MRRLRPIHALFIVLFFAGAVLAANYAFEGGFLRESYERVRPDTDGNVIVDIAELQANEVHFYRYLNYGNQEVRFFVGRDEDGHVHVAFDAAENDFKLKRGFRFHDGWMVNNKCDTSLPLAEVGSRKGGCYPVPLEHQIVGDTVVIADSQILRGWRFFR
ncbi:MAG: Fe-S-containing protein [Acidobacteriota bacterium]